MINKHPDAFETFSIDLFTIKHAKSNQYDRLIDHSEAFDRFSIDLFDNKDRLKQINRLINNIP